MNLEQPWGRLSAASMRWGRRLVYLVLLALLILAGWVHEVGLPGFLKAPLLAELRQRGVALEFDRLRLRLMRGIVAEKVRMVGDAEGSGVRVGVEDVEVRMGWGRLLGGNAPDVRGMVLKGGRIEVPLGSREGPGLPLTLDRVTARVAFDGTNVWRIEELSAHVLRGLLVVRGSVTNQGAWLARRRGSPPPTAESSDRWKEMFWWVARWMEATRFDRSPEVHLDFQADLLRPEQTAASLRVRALGASNEVFQAELADVHVRLGPARGVGTSDDVRVDLALEARGVKSRWLGCGSLRAAAWAEGVPASRELGRMKWTLDAASVANADGSLASIRAAGTTEARALGPGVEAPWGLPPEAGLWGVGQAAGRGYRSSVQLEVSEGVGVWKTQPAGLGSLELDLWVEHSRRGWREARAEIAWAGLQSPWASVRDAVLEVGMAPNPRPPAADPTWEFLRPLAHVDAWGWVDVGRMELSGRRDLPRVQMDGVGASWSWIAPWLEVGPFEARFGGGSVVGEGELDVSRRRATATARSDADPRGIDSWLAPAARAQLAHYEWPTNRPPLFEGSVGIELPRWSGFDQPTREQTLANLILDAQLDVGPVAFRGIALDRAHGRVTYTNRVWRIGPLQLSRPEGAASLQYENDERSRDFHFAFRSALQPSMMAPMLDERGRRELGRIVMPEPPAVEGEAWGRWGSPELVGIRAHVVATNVTVRGEPIEWAEGDVTFTNRILHFANVRARSDGEAWVPGAAYDTESKLLSFTNARATVPVWRVARIIGPRTADTMEPYRFPRPPKALVHGVVHVQGGVRTDIRFDIEADEFSWWKLRAKQVTAGVHLVGETVRIERLRSGFYGGSLGGDLYFDWSGPGLEVAYKLDLGVTNVVLKEFLADAWPGTNQLEGVLSGRGRVTSGRTSDPATVVGEGQVTMRDGYLWGLPVFGLFSPMLDALSPGLGQTRFTSGSATYTMTNGVIRTKDLEMQSAAMRLAYGGTVDFGGRLDATMQAELFRDAPLIGRLLSLALSPVTKLFEYEVQGTLAQPRPEPRYIPRFLMVLLRPTSLLKELLNGPGEPREKPEAETGRSNPASKRP